jgi:diguanylate cyclase (GGDEF)-like protein
METERPGLPRRFAGIVLDRSIGTKIVASVLVIAAIFVAGGLVGIRQIRELADQQDRQYRTNIVALAHMTNVRAAVSSQQEAVLSHILSAPGFYRAQYEETISATDSQLGAELDRIGEVDLSVAERNKLQVFEEVLRLWGTERDEALAASRQGDRARATSIVLVRSHNLVRAVEVRADEFLAALVEAVARQARLSRASSQEAERLLVVMLVAGAIVALALAILAARSISRPLRDAVDVFARVAAGDFSRRMRVRGGDELGRMSRSLNDTVATLQEAFEMLRHRATHDALTGLANRALLHERLDEAFLEVQDGVSLVLLLLDLDGFKDVNDSHGHAAGDALLVTVADRLRRTVRSGDTVARLGGDEFAVLLQESGTLEDAYSIADRILEAVQTPADVGGVHLDPRVSIGAAPWHGDLLPDHLLRQADIALYAAKGAGKGIVVRFSELDLHREHDGDATRHATA